MINNTTDNYISSEDANSGAKMALPGVTETRIAEALKTLNDYKSGKTSFDNRIVANEKWYRMRHWEIMDGDKTSQIAPASAWLLNSLLNKHADAMDNYPEPSVLPREETDRPTAEQLSSIVPVILEHNDFEQIYNDVEFAKLKHGTGIYGIFWDGSKLNGLGDVTMQAIDALELFWEPGIRDIQKSQNVFHVKLEDIDVLIRKYPFLEGKNITNSFDTAHYAYDDNIDTSKKASVIDWYYHKDGKLQYCKFVPGTVLFATENDPQSYPNGWYDHGLYPFVVDVCFPIADNVGGFGYVDIGKNVQMYIDRANQAIVENLEVNARPRFMSREGGGINEKEYLDTTTPIVHYTGDPNSILPIQGAGLSGVYVQYLQQMVQELKETTGNRDVATGGSTNGVTAATAIAALQEAAGSLSRDTTKASYRAFRKACYMVIELIRQFYDVPRKFRISGKMGDDVFTSFSNAGMLPQPQGSAYGVKLGDRLPIFDIVVTAAKQSAYSKLAQNELALQFYQYGFFNPQFADQALICLDMMDFDGKERVIQRIQESRELFMYQAAAMAVRNAQPTNGESGETQNSGGTANRGRAQAAQTIQV